MDAFWSQDTRTVSGNGRRLRREYFDLVDVLSIIIPVPIIGTNKVRDRVVVGCVIQNLKDLRRKGKWKDQLQWDSMQRTPTWYNNSWKAGAVSLEAGAIYLENVKKVYNSIAITESR